MTGGDDQERTALVRPHPHPDLPPSRGKGLKRTRWQASGRAVCVALLFSLCSGSGLAELGVLSISDFGAKGDGETDDTAAFQEALDQAGQQGAGLVKVPVGRFLIRGHLVLPQNVALEGIWRAPQRGDPPQAGSVLLAVEGKGNPDGPPFLKLNTQSTLTGLSVFYPEQVRENPPHAYPWTVQGEGDNCSIVNVTLINPYQAVDFGSKFCGRHWVNGLYAQALFRGIYINQCFDVGRIENIHFWPFWDLDPKSPTWEFTRDKGIAFLIGKTDGEMAFNCFSIFYRTGMCFIRGELDGGKKTAPGSGVYTNCYMDVTPCAIRVEEVAETAGVSFVNGMFMSKVQVSSENKGQVKFTGCGFWANKDQASHAELQGRGTVSFEACHFSNWDRMEKGAPCIDADCEGVIITGCEFETERADHLKVRLGSKVRSGIVTSNRMQAGVLIENRTRGSADIQIGLNSGL